MPDKRIPIVIAALALALVAVFQSVPNGWKYAGFRAGLFDAKGETQAVRETLKLFNASLAGFYTSGGSILGLNMFPAQNLIKRKIFLDIRLNQEAELVLVTDRDRSDVRHITFLDPDHAWAVVDEAWFMQYQNAATRRPVSGKKANFITVRYLLNKTGGKWLVTEYDVYGRNDRIPPVPPERLASW